jgi:hypothetical protein
MNVDCEFSFFDEFEDISILVEVSHFFNNKNMIHDPYTLLCTKTIEDLSMKTMLVDREEKRSKACIQYVAKDAQNCKLAI